MSKSKSKSEPKPKPSTSSPYLYENIPARTILHEVPSGVIATEVGADGVYLQFDCDCRDALPFCHAACCCLPGIEITEGERIPSHLTTENTMKRGADGYCRCNDPTTRLCTIYSVRPQTCRDFHCTRGPNMRGWKLDLVRLPEGE